MSIAALNWAWSQDCPNASSKLVLLALADKANEDGECWPGMGTVADMAGVSVRQVSTHLARLEEVGLLSRRRRRSGIGRLGSYVYYLKVTSGSTLPVDQQKSTSGSAPPVEADRQLRPSVVATGSPASSPPEAHFRTEPKENPKVNPHSSDVPSDQEFPEVVTHLTRTLAVAVKANGFPVPGKGKKAHRDWLLAMDRLLRLDKADPGEVERVIRWATEDTFWKGNIRSAPKFREQWPQLRLKMQAAVEQQSNVRPLRQDPVAARFGAGAR